MTNDFAERLVIAFESIAKSLAGIDESVKKAISKYSPEPREPRQAVVTRVPNEDDRNRSAQGASEEPIKEWLADLGGEFIGEREKAFLEEQKRQQNASAKASSKGKQKTGSRTKTRNKA